MLLMTCVLRDSLPTVIHICISLINCGTLNNKIYKGEGWNAYGRVWMLSDYNKGVYRDEWYSQGMYIGSVWQGNECLWFNRGMFRGCVAWEWALNGLTKVEVCMV